MNIFKASASMMAITCLLLARSALAQTTSDDSATSAHVNRTDMPIIYVGDFQTVPAPVSGSFPRLRAEHDARKIDANAQKLVAAIVKALEERGVTAYSLSSTQSMPSNGLLVNGTYAQTISHSSFPMISAIVQGKKPNTDATISIKDLNALHTGAPISFVSSASLKGQTRSFSTNPYKLAAHIVIHQIEANSSMSSLADSIANGVLAAEAPPLETAYVIASPLR